MMIFDYFQDPVLQAPVIGCMLLCFVAAIVGTFVFLGGKSLIGETLSHAVYPGVIGALFIQKLLAPNVSEAISLLFIFVGAFLACLLATYAIKALEKRFRVPTDSALAFILVSFFGIGFCALTALQQDFPALSRELSSYLFGQAATMRLIHIHIFLPLAIAVLSLVALFYRSLQVALFDATFSKVVGLSLKKMDALIFFMMVIAVVLSMRSAGVVLISAMLIFPAATARFWTNKLSHLLIIAGSIGITAGFFGVVISHETSMYLQAQSVAIVSLPTGPLIVFVAGMLFLFSLIFAPRGGIALRYMKKASFLLKCKQENALKSIWKLCSTTEEATFSRKALDIGSITYLMLQKNGWIEKIGKDQFRVTFAGLLWGRKIVRLHRLWELYLVNFCKVPKERVHPSAEEMEHIITPEIESELTYILDNPKKDPHAKPIPQNGYDHVLKSLLR